MYIYINNINYLRYYIKNCLCNNLFYKNLSIKNYIYDFCIKIFYKYSYC